MQPEINIFSMWKRVSKLVEINDGARLKADRIIDLLMRHFENPSVFGRVNLKIKKIEAERHVANITYPFGSARFILKLSDSDGHLAGALVAERERYDAYDNRLWEPVWEMLMPNDETPYLVNGHSENKVYFDLNDFYQNVNQSVADVGAELVYALVYGPKQDEPNN